MTEKPFTHKFAFTNVKSNFIFHDEFAKIFIRLLPFKGIINIGGKRCSIYKFALKTNKKVLPMKYVSNKITSKLMPDTSVNINKLKSILKGV